MKRVAGVLLPILFTFALLVYALWDVDRTKLWSILVQGQLWVVPPFVLLLFLFFLVNAQRWTRLLAPFGRYSPRQVAPAMMIGFAANNVLPLRIGEIIRAVIFAKEFAHSRTGVLMTLVVERALDLVGILLIFSVGVLLVGEVPIAFKISLIAALAGVGMLMFVLILLARLPWITARLWTWISQYVPAVVASRGQVYLEEFGRGIEVLGSLRATVSLFLQSLLRWGMAAALVWLSLASYGVFASLGLAMIVVGVTAVAVSLPSVPGYIGPVQAAFVFALVPFGISQEEALAASIFFLIGHWVPITFTGAVYFVSRHYSYRQIRREAAAMDDL